MSFFENKISFAVYKKVARFGIQEANLIFLAQCCKKCKESSLHYEKNATRLPEIEVEKNYLLYNIVQTQGTRKECTRAKSRFLPLIYRHQSVVFISTQQIFYKFLTRKNPLFEIKSDLSHFLIVLNQN